MTSWTKSYVHSQLTDGHCMAGPYNANLGRLVSFLFVEDLLLQKVGQCASGNGGRVEVAQIDQAGGIASPCWSVHARSSCMSQQTA